MKFSVDEQVFFLRIVNGKLKIFSLIIRTIESGCGYFDKMVRYFGSHDELGKLQFTSDEIYRSYDEAASQAQMQANLLRNIGHSNE